MPQASDIQPVSAANYVNVACIVVLLYDYALTFGMEVEFIWKQKIQFCSMWSQADKWLGIFTILVIDVLLVLRTWALWGLSKVILISLGILLVLSVAVQSWALTLAAPQPSPDNVQFCTSRETSPTALYVTWVCFIVFDSTVMSLTLIKALPSIRRNASTPLITRLLKDGVQYFLIIFLASVTNIIMIASGSAVFESHLGPSYQAMMAAIGSRLILSLRGSLLPANNTGQTISKLGTIVFNTLPGNQTTFNAYPMEDIEDPQDAAGQRDRRVVVPRRTSEYSSSSDSI